MLISTLIIDPKDVLFMPATEQPYLKGYLQNLGLQPRHPQVVEKALRAARFDVLLGRITRDVYYDAILRFHGVPDYANLKVGREALLADSVFVTPNVKAIAVLNQLYVAGINLSLVLNSEHSGREIALMLSHFGFVHTLWNRIITSSEIGYIIPDPAIFDAIIDQPEGNVYLSRQAIPWLIQHGVINLVYGDDKSVLDAYNIHEIEQLIDLLVA